MWISTSCSRSNYNWHDSPLLIEIWQMHKVQVFGYIEWLHFLVSFLVQDMLPEGYSFQQINVT